MKKRWYYILVAVGLALVLAGCDSHESDHPNIDPPPKIDPPVNELLRKDFETIYKYEYEYVMRKPKQTTVVDEE